MKKGKLLIPTIVFVAIMALYYFKEAQGEEVPVMWERLIAALIYAAVAFGVIQLLKKIAGPKTKKIKKPNPYEGLTDKEIIRKNEIKNGWVLDYKKDKFDDLENGGVFETTAKIGDYFKYDKTNQKIQVIYKSVNYGGKPYSVYKLADVLEFEYVENGTSKVSGGLGRALVGGALFGGVGAIVGGVTGTKEKVQNIEEMKIKLVINRDIPKIDYLVLNFFKVKSNSSKYQELLKQAHEIVSLLQYKKPKEIDSVEELKKFKNLLEEGLITQEDFDKKKNEILGL